jgi:hypothetical protein
VPTVRDPKPNITTSNSQLRYAPGILISIYFLYIAYPSLSAKFAFDDPGNLYQYWHVGLASVLRSNLLFFSSDYRPMGGVFYLPIFWLAKLNPLPYHLVVDLILAANTWLLYRFCRLVGAPLPVAGMATLIHCSHVAMISLFLSPSNVYDALCVLFFFGALVYYVGIRSRGKELSFRQVCICLALYVGALNSKEIGVTLPVCLAAYELIYHGPRPFKLSWVVGSGRTAVLGLALAVVYVGGKLTGANSLAEMDAYRPVYTWTRFISNNGHFLDNFAYQKSPWFTPGSVLCVWLGLGIVAWLQRERYLRLSWIFILVLPLPLAFIPQRGLYNLYLPLAGWVILAAGIVWRLILLVTPAALPRQARLVLRAALYAIVIMLWVRDRAWRAPFSIAASAEMQVQTWNAIQQLQHLAVPIQHNSKAIFLRDPFRDWDMFFIAALSYRDPTIQFFLQSHSKLPQSEIEKMDYVFDWNGEKLVVLKQANVSGDR